jgi:hypothetical protein
MLICPLFVLSVLTALFALTALSELTALFASLGKNEKMGRYPFIVKI